MTTISNSSEHGRPHMTSLDEGPQATPHWVIHPRPTWLEMRPGNRGLSTIINHLSNIEIVRWIDRAAELSLEAAGWSYEKLHESNSMFFVARHEIDYRTEALPDEIFHIGTWVRDIKRVKSWRDTVIWTMREDSPEVVCTASTLWVHVDLTTRKPTRIGDDMCNALEPLQQDASPWRART